MGISSLSAVHVCRNTLLGLVVGGRAGLPPELVGGSVATPTLRTQAIESPHSSARPLLSGCCRESSREAAPEGFVVARATQSPILPPEMFWRLWY